MIKDKKFENEILGKLTEGSIQPRPRWHFLLKNYVLFGSGIFLLFVGGLSFSVLIYLIRFNDWSVYEHFSDSLLGFILLTLPYFWIVLLVVFVALLNYNIRHTKKGYRFRLPVIVLFSIVSSIILGVLFFSVGFGHAIDDVLGEKVPYYSKVINPHVRLWEKPGQGRLAGLVVERLTDCEYQLVDRARKEWFVNLSRMDPSCGHNIEIGRLIKVLGSLDQNKNDFFWIEKILPMGPGRGIFKHHERRGGRVFSEEGMREKVKELPVFREKRSDF